MRRPSYLLSAMLLVLLIPSSPAYSQSVGVAIAPGEGVEFAQLDFPDNDPPAPNSSIGLVQVNLLLLRGLSGLESGFLNVVIDNNWVVRNMMIPSETVFPYSELAAEFDLGITEIIDVTSVEAEVVLSEDVLENAPFSPPLTFQVGTLNISAGGVDGDAGVAGNASLEEPKAEFATYTGTETTVKVQKDHPNIQAAVNQCYPMSVANSLQYLENTTDLEIPHNHVSGLKSRIGAPDLSLVGQLGRWMDRTVTDRLNGSGVRRTPGLIGKLKYLSDNGLEDRVETRHWGRSNIVDEVELGIQNSDVTATAPGGNEAKSTFQAAKFSIEDMKKALDRGEDCEAIYSWPAGTNRQGRAYGAGAHAVDLVGYGVKKSQFAIVESSDLDQKDDTKGAGVSGLRAHNLSDTDMDGYFNFDGTTKELDTLICQKYIPEPPELPPWIPFEEDFWIQDLPLIITDFGGDLSHLCCAEPPPGVFNIWHSQPYTMAADDLPFSFSGNVPWLPASGMPPGNDGNFILQSISTVAGFLNVQTQITGQFTADRVSGVIDVGSNGQLPGGLPISYFFEAFPPGPPGSLWPWIEQPLPPPPDPLPIIRVNGERHSLTLAPFEPFSIGLGVESGGQDTLVDFFLVAQIDEQLFSFDLESDTFMPGLFASSQGPLRDIPNLPILTDLNGLPPMDVILYFGFDTLPNGLLDPQVLVFEQFALQIQTPGP